MSGSNAAEKAAETELTESIGEETIEVGEGQASAEEEAEDSALTAGWKKINGKFLYFTTSRKTGTIGKAVSGFTKIGKRRYFV